MLVTDVITSALQDGIADPPVIVSNGPEHTVNLDKMEPDGALFVNLGTSNKLTVMGGGELVGSAYKWKIAKNTCYDRLDLISETYRPPLGQSTLLR